MASSSGDPEPKTSEQIQVGQDCKANHKDGMVFAVNQTRPWQGREVKVTDHFRESINFL